MQTGVIVRRNPEQFIPDAFLEHILKTHNSAWSAAVIDGEEGLKTSSGGKDDMSVAHFKEIMESFPKRGITFYFCASEGAINEDDLFPQTLMFDDADNPTLSVFVDANVPGLAKKGSSLTPETHFVDDWLRPKLSEIVEANKLSDDDGNVDIPKLMIQLSKGDFKKEALAQCVGRGAITLISDKGTVSFSTGDTGKEFPWGWVSNHLGFGVAKEKEKEQPKKKDMFAKRSTVREAAPVAGTGPQPVIAKASVPAAPKGEVALKPLYSIKKDRPGPNISRKDKKQHWYPNRIGYLPVGWEQGVEIEHYADQTGKLLVWGNIKKLGLEAAGLPKLTNPPRVGSPEADAIDGGPRAPSDTLSGAKLPMITPKGRDYMNALLDRADIKKIISETGNVVATAEQAKAMEAKIADFMTQLGRKDVTIVDIMKFPYEWLFKIAQERPDIAATLMWNWKNMLLPRLSKEFNAPKQEIETVKSEIVGDGTVETEKEEVKPKRDMFAKRKAA
jgi:hypothetical protein